MNEQMRQGHGRARLLAGFGIGGAILWIFLALAGCSTSSVFGPDETLTPTSTPVPTETPGPSPTPDPVQPDDIVYVRRFVFGLSGDLYLVHPNGLAPRQITAFTRDQASAASDFPMWRPDHQGIVFASEYRDLYNLAVWNLYTIDPDGKGSQQVTGLPQPNGGYFPSTESAIPGVSVWAMLTAPPGVAVRGRVRAGDQPVEGAVVVSWLGRGFARTDKDGYYTLPDVPGGHGWIKATAEPGLGWTWVNATSGGPLTAPDITLDPRLAGAEYRFPAWDPRGGLWSLYSQHWFDPTSHAARVETGLLHLDAAGGHVTAVYTATQGTLGRPRANPAHPEQVAIVDNTDLLLLTVDLGAPAGARVTTRQVLHAAVLRNSPVAWAPDGSRLYFVQPARCHDNFTSGYEALCELTLATGAVRDVAFFWPKEQENTGFDLSPDGTEVVYEENGDLFIRSLDAPQTVKPRHITYYGQGSQPTWGGR